MKGAKGKAAVAIPNARTRVIGAKDMMSIVSASKLARIPRVCLEIGQGLVKAIDDPGRGVAYELPGDLKGALDKSLAVERAMVKYITRVVKATADGKAGVVVVKSHRYGDDLVFWLSERQGGRKPKAK